MNTQALNAKNQARITQMQSKLEQALQPEQLEIIDDSHLHIGHRGAQGGAGHFTVIIKAAPLTGLTRVQQHQKIYQILDDMMTSEIHALSIKVQQ